MKEGEAVYRVTLAKVKGSNVLAPSAIYIEESEIIRSVLKVMDSGDEVVLRKYTYEEFLKMLPDNDVIE